MTALFINTRTLNFENQLTFAFFAAVNHLFQGSLLVIVIMIDGSEKTQL